MAERVRRQCGCVQQQPLRCACSPTQSQQICACTPYSPCACSSSTPSCSAPCQQQCINSCLQSSPSFLCQITCQRTCDVACSGKQLYNSAPIVNTRVPQPLAVVVKPTSGLGCSNDCNNKCTTACISLRYGSAQCSDSCRISCGRVCDKTSATFEPARADVDLGVKPPTNCLSTCSQACQSSCNPTISSSQCQATCDSTCIGLCPNPVTTPTPTLVTLEPITYPTTLEPSTVEVKETTTAPPVQQQTPEPLKINIKLLPPTYLSPQFPQSALITPSPFLQCLRQCDIGCQQSCRQRTPPPSEGCDASCVNTCNYVCAPSQPAQMTANDVSTFPVRLDPKQRCSSECQSVCHLACTSRLPSNQCADSCVPQCDRACASPQIQKNSADLFAQNPDLISSLTETSTTSPPVDVITTTESPLKINIVFEPTTPSPPTLQFSRMAVEECSKACSTACARQCRGNSNAYCSAICKIQCYKEICPKSNDNRSS
ncbi:hypothetical protein RB195_020853 [Necator americanus]|uniref:Cysteine rich repeat-containing domain protein n=1 Tax=Necator americanus TaxID=51031 RepID=A0ABR1CNJ6_NECAM